MSLQTDMIEDDASKFWAAVEELADSVSDTPVERREMSGVRDAARGDWLDRERRRLKDAYEVSRLR